MTAAKATILEVRKDDWSDTRFVSEAVPDELATDEVLLAVDRLALTANNISYASAGDSLGYWRFFPAEEGWGRIPAMGWAEVIASANPEIAVGERVWGFFPMATHLKILAGKLSPQGFADVSPHRQGLAPVYANFDRASAYPIYEPAREDQDSLLRGLFMTSWLVEDFLEVNDFFAAHSCLITSASSKTSIALGHCVKQRGAMASVAVTSTGNAAFCSSLGCYDRVVTYERLATLDANSPVVMVDMAGSARILSELHHHYGDNMKHSCRIGATHLEGFGPLEELPGARPEFFFAPEHLQTRSKELGAGEFMMRLGSAYAGFRQFCDGWLNIEHSRGREAVQSAYQKVLAGKADPASGQIISLD
ncbi:DUF2855 family protein [Seongchinamella sediminis]|uniref:DUF2855 family protein n=1 Tax=Seongchinamella sediminis TaxID=2283635 RepID=A0A3L7DYH0_9GAMM|nr:DUF2855 family protein [Seongchinamella sediminis]RLQ22647.1 DUF2855 family protein [Seongchinamella sediminis]